MILLFAQTTSTETEGVPFRLILSVVLLLGLASALFFSRDKAKSCLLLFIGTLALGFRSLHLTHNLDIHPAEVCLWICFGFSLSSNLLGRNGGAIQLLPTWVKWMIPFWILGFVLGFGSAYSWDIQLSEFRIFLLLIPLYVAAQLVLARPANWRTVALALYVTGTCVACSGILEYAWPGAAHIIPGFSAAPTDRASEDGFVRAGFSFYGNPVAVFVCALALPFGIYLWQTASSSSARVWILAGAALQLWGIYISGCRSIWLLVAVQFLLWSLLRKQFVVGVVFVVLALAAGSLLPDVSKKRLQSLTLMLEGRPIDSSGAKRWDRAMDAWDLALKNPLGSGWAASGWVHSDFIQVAANLGLIAGAIFAGGYLMTLVKLGQRTLGQSSKMQGLGARVFPMMQARHVQAEAAKQALGHSVLLSFVGAGHILATECTIVYPQTALPVWLTLALAQTWLKQHDEASSLSASPAHYDSTSRLAEARA
jgi:hypothetical protein